MKGRGSESPQEATHDADGRGPIVVVLGVAIIALATIVIGGVIAERAARTPIIAVGQPAPAFTLPSTNGSTESLNARHGSPVVLAFLPSVMCDQCRRQMRALQEALPALRARGVAVYGISVDESPLQRSAAADLRLSYPLLSEAPTRGQHPAGSAYGLYHYPQPNPGPVETNAIVVVDGQGVVRAVRVQPDGAISADDIVALVGGAIGTQSAER